MPEKIEFEVAPEEAGCRLDLCLARRIPDSSRSFLQKLIRDGGVRVGGDAIPRPRRPVSAGERIEVQMPAFELPLPAPEPFEFDILYEDDQLLVIDKPPGVVVHPGSGNPDGTVMNALLGRYPALAGRLSADELRPGIVHRLDKDTSGCLAAAKTPEAQYKLCAAFAERKTSKYYLALVRGVPSRERGEITTLIGRHPINRQKMAVVERNGKTAVTHYETIARGELGKTPVTLLKVKIATGRTHQIRVHMSSLHLPVLGDTLYGGAPPESGIARQMLHAWRLSFPHPSDGRKISVSAPLPADFQAALKKCKMEDIIEKFISATGIK